MLNMKNFGKIEFHLRKVYVKMREYQSMNFRREINFPSTYK